jgi:hypothetical protein
MIVLNERWDKWIVGIGWVDQQWVTPRFEREWGGGPVFIDYNLFVHGQRLLKWKKLEIGIGAAYFQNTNRVSGTHFTVSSSIGYHFNKHLTLNIRHFSNAGSGSPNLGQDALLIGWTF